MTAPKKTGARAGLIGGRFAQATSEEMQRFSSSLAIDLGMLDEDVDGSIAHATMLGEVGMLTPEEAETLCAGLEKVREEIRSGAWTPSDVHEDIHMAVEARLTQLVGDAGKKLHTARSRNDQVATDVRLWLKRRLAGVDEALGQLLESLIHRIEEDGATLMAGYTHLQRGQPILLGHHLLAHAWAVTRDRDRFRQALRRLDECPLGACAMAGTPHPINRHRTAELLGFSGAMENAMDAVSTRDHEIEVASACAIAMTHLSRMCEELVIWSSSEFALVRLGEDYATGSSIMPQKRNPDAAELVRGKSARVIGDLQTLLTLVKAQTMAYNRDLQEDREALFDAVETTLASLRITAGIWSTLEVNQNRFEAELDAGFSLATELADLLAERGVPFREAHEVVGRMVRWCEERGSKLDAVTPEAARDFHPKLPEDLSPWLVARAAAERRTSFGGTASVEIQRQTAKLKGML